MLPPFHIRNLQPSNWPIASQDSLVRITAPRYDETISSHPAATLKYLDEDDGDLITLGSSRELTEKLEEPFLPPSSGLPADLHYGLQSSEYHVFEIDDRNDVQKLWQDIKDSEGTPVAQDHDEAAKWSAEKKNRLAHFYERRKAEIWNPIAEELGVTWQSVDAMHWALGREEMALRAYELNPRSEQSRSSDEITETKSDPMYSVAAMQQLEDYRVHHFNATRPPQIRLPRPVSPQQVKATAGHATVSKVSVTDLDHSASLTTDEDGASNLAVEGKRQAQAAGDKLRSRMTAVDGHQNRWATYKSSTSAFLPKASTSLSLAFDGPGLTSEGKRQAQVAGDKLRCRTNPIRHLRPSRTGALENGISKNRWSSYSGTRATRFDERQDAQDSQDELRGISTTVDNGEMSRNGQPSLLEVFEAELAKKISATDSQENTGSESPVQILAPEPAVQVDPSNGSNGQPLPQDSHALLGIINERLQDLIARDTALPQDFSTAIDHGIRTAGAAVCGLSAYFQSIARGLQEVSSVSRQAADRTRNADSQLINDAVLGFQSLTEGFTAAFGETAANGPRTTSAPRRGLEEINIGSTSAALGILHDKDPEEDVIVAHKSNQSPLSGSVDSSKLAYNLEPKHAAAPSYISEHRASQQLETESQPRFRPAMSKEPRFHEPEPVPLPNRPGYVDHLRRSQSTKLIDEQRNVQYASSPPLDTHFSTLNQFEGENFGASPTFPALPSMKPLVPQRANRQYMYGSKAEEIVPANGSLPPVSRPKGIKVSRQAQNRVAGRHEHSAQRNGHEAIPSSAARLAEPFDPLEAEPPTRPQLSEGLRRNATIAGTDIRRGGRRRRPYSEVFDGTGRVSWGKFERKGLYRSSDDAIWPPGADHKHLESPSQLDADLRRSPSAAAGYDDQHHDDSTVGKINYCVERLRDLGFGGEDNDSACRLLVYAQAADGVLVDAIDLIDEEQRAWQRL